MKSLMNVTITEVRLPSQVVEAISYEQLARTYYENHTRTAKFYLRRTAILMAISLGCAMVTLFGGPRIFIVATIAISLVLLLRKVEANLGSHLKAAIEYRLSIADFEELEDTNGLQRAIDLFKLRCQRYDDPCSISTDNTHQMN